MSIKSIQIGNKIIGTGYPTFFIAEEGQANQGNLSTAKEMVELAVKAKADAIEFQLCIAEDFYIKSHPGYKIYLDRNFSEQQLKELVDKTKQEEIIMISTCLSSNLVPVLKRLGCEAFNINSSDIDNPDMLSKVALSGNPFFISTAMSTMEEIDWAVKFIMTKGNLNFGILHGQHIMHTKGDQGVPENQVQLSFIKKLNETYKVPVGFIDHTSGNKMPAIAAAQGANMITKHFCKDRNQRGPDWQICLEPEELYDAIQLVRIVDASKGNGEKKILANGEENDKKMMRRSIVAQRRIEEGKVIEKEDLSFKRPGGGIPANKQDEIIGKISKRNIRIDEQLTYSDY